MSSPRIKLIQKPKEKPKPEADLSKLKILVVDNGLFHCVAEHLSKYYGKVYYTKPTAAAFLKGSQHIIGKGLPDVEWIEDMETHVRKVDEIFFPDINYGYLQIFLKEEGYKVVGALGGERMELDKIFFLEQLQKAGLAVPKTRRVKGLDEAWDFLKDKFNEKYWLKNADRHRGDWETDKHDCDPWQTEIIFNEKRAELGMERCKDIELLIQEDIPDAIEIGKDTFNLNGQTPDNSLVGIEEKAQFYIAKVFKKTPPILDKVERALEPVYKSLGMQGPYSTENRIIKNGTIFPLDDCDRCGNPPTSLMLEIYQEDYARAIHSLANGEMPVLNPKFTHGAEIVMGSRFHEKHELHVPDIPKSLRQWVKLRNATRKENKQTYCIFNDTGGHCASVVSVGNSIDEVGGLVEERADELKLFDKEYTKGFLDIMKPKIAKAKAYANISLD